MKGNIVQLKIEIALKIIIKMRWFGLIVYTFVILV